MAPAVNSTVPFSPAMKTITHVPSVRSNEAKETIRIGPVVIRILEDGSNTDMRLGLMSADVPAHTPGPPQHWHEMHDETFLVTHGSIRFHTGDTYVDAKGDLVVVPPRAPHTFENVTGEEAGFFNTFTPAFYINYFRLLQEMAEGDGGKLSKENARIAMERYATMQLQGYGKEEVPKAAV